MPPPDQRRDILIEALRQQTPVMHRRLEKLRRDGRRRREREDFLWHALLTSFSTMGNARGYEGLIENEDLYQQLTFGAFSRLSPEQREKRADDVLRKAGVRMPARKARWLRTAYETIQDLGGLEAGNKHALCLDGREAKIQFMKQFNGVGPKYARNIWMDAYDPDFRQAVAVDQRLQSITKKIGFEFEDYDKHEAFYLQIAKEAGLDGWDVDRLLFNFHGYFEAAIEDAAFAVDDHRISWPPDNKKKGDSAPASLECAVEIAARAHAGQTDKTGAPYLLHLMRVGLQQETESAMIAGVLHDLVEDTAWTVADLEEEGFPAEVVETIERLTRRPEESYEGFIRRVGEHPMARQVKIADLEDNMDVTRLESVGRTDADRLAKYLRAW